MRFQTLFVLDLQGKVKELAVKNAEYGREAIDPEDFFCLFCLPLPSPRLIGHTERSVTVHFKLPLN